MSRPHPARRRSAAAFPALLRRLRRRYDTVRKFAAALGIEPSRLSRAMGHDRHAQPFDVRGCLNLAKVTNEDPSLVLRAAGKGEIADLIEVVYEIKYTGAGRLREDHKRLIAAYDQTPAGVRISLLAVAQAAAGMDAPAADDDDGDGHALPHTAA